jgi:hypothetical protein
MTTDDFRRMALELPGALESAHMGHPDFRVNGKIFATLHYPDENWGMVKLPVEHQDDFVRTQPTAFVPVKGAWGRQGCTNVRLKAAEESSLQHALRLAWSKASTPSSAPRKKRSAKLV